MNEDAPTSQARAFARTIKLGHSIFALPFALAAAVLAARDHGITLLQLVSILVAMVAARSAAMGFNRLVDRDIDADNPRTADREIPAGKVSATQARLLVLGSCGVFVLGAAALQAAEGVAVLPVGFVLDRA